MDKLKTCWFIADDNPWQRIKIIRRYTELNKATVAIHKREWLHFGQLFLREEDAPQRRTRARSCFPKESRGKITGSSAHSHGTDGGARTTGRSDAMLRMSKLQSCRCKM
jgi:hypothetical protein